METSRRFRDTIRAERHIDAGIAMQWFMESIQEDLKALCGSPEAFQTLLKECDARQSHSGNGTCQELILIKQEILAGEWEK
jgi:hypothetical protein